MKRMLWKKGLVEEPRQVGKGNGNDGKNLSAPIHDLRGSRTPGYNVSPRSIDGYRSQWEGRLDDCFTGICRGNTLRFNGIFLSIPVSE